MNHETFSLERIAKGDLGERAALLFTIAPVRFKALAKQQGWEIKDVREARALASEVQEGRTNTKFNFTKLFASLPVSRKDLNEAGRNGLKLV